MEFQIMERLISESKGLVCFIPGLVVVLVLIYRPQFKAYLESQGKKYGSLADLIRWITGR